MEGRVVLHSDLNNCYASIECMLHPELRGKYIAVCGSTEDRHGIVLAKNQLAKQCGVSLRRYAILCIFAYSGLPGFFYLVFF